MTTTSSTPSRPASTALDLRRVHLAAAHVDDAVDAAPQHELAACQAADVAGFETAGAEPRIRLRQVGLPDRRRLHDHEPFAVASLDRGWSEMRTPSTGVPTVPRSAAPPSRS